MKDLLNENGEWEIYMFSKDYLDGKDILKLRAVPRPCRELGVDRIRWNGLYSSDYCVADMYKKLEGKG